MCTISIYSFSLSFLVVGLLLRITIIKEITPATGNAIVRILLIRKPALFSSPRDVGKGFKILGGGWCGTKTLKDAKTITDDSGGDDPLFTLAITW